MSHICEVFPCDNLIVMLVTLWAEGFAYINANKTRILK